MGNHVLVWDLETVPDLAAVARVHGLDEADAEGCRTALGDKFAKLPLHKVACIGALVAERTKSGWEVRSVGAPHFEERSEAELLQAFADRIADLEPQMVTFNGTSFDLPVLRYRAMVNRVSAPGVSKRPYFARYTADALDLCDALASFDQRGKCSLNDLCRILSALAEGITSYVEKENELQIDVFRLWTRAGLRADVQEWCLNNLKGVAVFHNGVATFGVVSDAVLFKTYWSDDLAN